MDRIEIKLVRMKIIKFIFLVGLFIIGFLNLFFYPEMFISIRFQNIIFIRIVGFIGSLFFCFFLLPLFSRLLDWKSGLILDEKGITINTSSFSLGFPIRWEDITAIDETHYGNTSLLIFRVKNKGYYLRRVKNPITKFVIRRLAIASIGADTVEYDYDEIKRLVFIYYKYYGNNER